MEETESKEILRDEVLDEVNKITAYTGMKAGSVDALASTADDERIMRTFWNEALLELLPLIEPYGNIFADGGEGLSLEVRAPVNWKRDNLADFCSLVRQFLINALCAQWFGLNVPEKAASYQEANRLLSVSLKRCMSGRSKPTRWW